eukprot:3447507-Pleurochrysis_carterae.AAC.3
MEVEACGHEQGVEASQAPAEASPEAAKLFTAVTEDAKAEVNSGLSMLSDEKNGGGQSEEGERAASGWEMRKEARNFPTGICARICLTRRCRQTDRVSAFAG